MMRLPWVIWLLLASGAAADSPLVQAAQRGPAGERFRRYSRLQAGMPAPPLATTAWLNSARPIAIGGRPMLLNFWSRTCGRCLEEMPRVDEIARTNAARLTVVSVHPATPASALHEYAQSVRHPIAIDTGATRDAYGVTGFPTYVWIDEKGVVLAKLHKPPGEHQLRQLLAGEAPAPRALADLTRDIRLKETSITIDPIRTGELFRGIHATRWLNRAAPAAGELRGRVLLIDYWAVWCLPCLENLDTISAHARRFGDALTVIGVHYESDVAPVQQFVTQRRLLFPVAIDTDETWRTSSLNALPTYLLVDRRGIVRYKSNTPPSEQQIAALIAER